MNFTIGQYLVVAPSEYERFGRGKNDYTLSGLFIYQPGSVVPIIVETKGCREAAKITKVVLNESSTTVTFTIVDLPEEMGEQMYSYYMNTSAGSNATDKYQASKSQLIPGIYQGKNRGRF